jgi:hypothetical protein
VTNDATFDIGHPAPHRGQIGLGLLALSLLAAPVVWSLQLLSIYGFASYACAPGQMPASGWAHWVLPLVNLAALAVVALATLLSLRNLRHTRQEHEDQTGGMMDAGEGRTRFLSIWGIWMGVLFLLAIAFNTVAVFWVGLCDI